MSPDRMISAYADWDEACRLVHDANRSWTSATGPRARIAFWHGMACENVVQAVAADVLRGTLVRLENEYPKGNMNVRLHTHDEVVCETELSLAKATEISLRYQMRRGFDWSEGLPLMSEETVSPYYTKHEGVPAPKAAALSADVADYPLGVPIDICQLFEELALKVRAKGWERYSARAILHRIRWEFQVERDHREFKCNNNWTPRMARWLMAKHLHMDGFFEIRELRRVYKYDEE